MICKHGILESKDICEDCFNADWEGVQDCWEDVSQSVTNLCSEKDNGGRE